MSFDRPELLWLALLAPLEILVILRRVPRLKAAFELLAGPRHRERAGALYAGASIYGAVFSLLFVVSAALALAGPAWGSRAVTAERSGLEVAVVLDVSRSMMVNEGGATRLQTAREFVRSMLRVAPSASYSLVATKGQAVLLVPMTDDIDAIDSGLDYADPEAISAVGTDLEAGLDVGLASFTERSGANRLLVLISDGGEHGADSMRAAAEVRRLRARLVAVGVGGPEALPVPGPNGSPLLDARGTAVRSALEPALLKQVAARAGGRYVEAGDPGARAVMQSELTELVRGGRRTEYAVEDRSGLFAMLALAFLIARVLASIAALRGDPR